MTQSHPASIPAGLRLGLSRARVKPGMSDEVDRWMAMLNEREDECLATLDRDGMALEAVFRRTDADGDWLYWFSLRSSDAPTDVDAVDPDARSAIDRDHTAYSRRCKEPGWQEAEPQLLLMPEPVHRAVTEWAAGRHRSRETTVR